MTPFLEERTGSDSIRHIQGPGIDTALATVDSSSIVRYYVGDHLGSLVQITNAAASIQLSRHYDPFGRLTDGAAVEGYAYTGREWDAATELYFYRGRFYDPVLQRFLSEDPMGFGAGSNFYSYVRNSPTTLIDPFGLQEGSPQNRARRRRIAEVADSHIGSNNWLTDLERVFQQGRTSATCSCAKCLTKQKRRGHKAGV